jgi:Ca2+-binding RTX toxin-like protein
MTAFTTSAALVTADTVALFDLPPRARVINGYLKADQLDTGAGLTLSVGIAGTPTLFMNASTIGRTAGGGVDRTLAFTGLDYVTAGRTRVILTATAGAATPANGKVVVMLNYTVEEPA